MWARLLVQSNAILKKQPAEDINININITINININMNCNLNININININTEVSQKKLQVTVQTKVNQMSLKEMKEAVGGLQTAPGTREDWSPKVFEKEMQKLVDAQRLKVEAYTKIVQDFKAELKAEVRARHPDGLSADEMQAIDDALVPGASKFISASSGFTSGSFAHIRLSLASCLQPLVLTRLPPEVGKFYAKPSGGKGFAPAKVFVDLKDVGEVGEFHYQLNLPVRIVVCSSSPNACAMVLKSANRKGFTAGELDTTYANKLTAVGVPTAAMLQPGDSHTLGWDVRPVKAEENPVCSTEFVPFQFEPPSYCKSNTIALPVLRIDMQSLKKRLEDAEGVTIDKMETTLVELTRSPFYAETSLLNLVLAAKQAKDAAKDLKSKRPAEKTPPAASKKPRGNDDDDVADAGFQLSQGSGMDD